MRWKSTFTENVKRALCVLYLLLAITLVSLKSYGQSRIYANTVTYTSPNGMSSLLGCGALGLAPCYNTLTVEDASNATSNDNTSFARVKSGAGLAVGIGAYQGELELKFPSTLPAGTTSYIRINTASPDLLNSLLGGNLGSLLAKAAGTVVLGDRYFEVGARMGTGNANNVLSGSSAYSFTNKNLKLIKDANGYFYLAITPAVAYDRVYVKDFTNAIVGLGATSYTDVYYAFYGSGTNPCAPAFATSFEGTGLSLDLLGIGKAGVTNSQYAIDSDPNTYSELSLGLLSVAGSISQDIYFETLSNPGDDINFKVQANQSLLTAGLLNNLKVVSYNGSTPIDSAQFSNLLNLDLLGLLNSGQITSIPFKSPQPFNRVKITFSSLLNANLTQTIRLYDANRSAGKPTFTAPASNAIAACSGSAASLTATTANTNELLWYDTLTGGTPTVTAYNGVFVTPALTVTKTYYVASRRLGCPTESAREPVTVTVNPAIVFKSTLLGNASIGAVYSKQITAATGGTPSFTYALATGSTLPAGIILSSAGLLSGAPSAAGNFNFAITATDSKGCTTTTAFTLLVQSALSLTAVPLANGTVGVVYPTQTIPAAAGGTEPYTYSVPSASLPPGLIFDPLTRQISGTPTAANTYTVPVTVVDQNGVSITTDFSILVRLPLSLASGALPDGIVGTAYSPQTIPAAAGGLSPYTYVATNLPAGLVFNTTTRVISGTPTQSGSYTVSVTAKDAENNTVTATYTLKVAGQLNLPVATLPSGTVDIPYISQTLPAVTGGTSPYTYVATNLPAGLVFNPTTRTLSGTPTLGGSFTFSVKASDNANPVNSTTTDYNLNVGVSDPIAANATVCSGKPATLSVSNVQTHVTYNWYASSGTAVVANGATYNTGNLSSTTTYYVEAISGTAKSTKVPVVVTVSPAPAPAVLTSGNLIISPGQSAILQAATTDGSTIHWYANATGGVELANGPSYTTPILNTTTTYYIESVSAIGCTSLSRVPATVTVTTGTPNANCNAANSQQTAIDGACILCSITGAGNSTDDNPNNFTQINLGVGVGAIGYQRLIFPSVGAATDSIRLDLETPTGLLDLGILSGITVKVINGSTVVATYPLNSSLINLKLLVSNRFKATLAANGVYDRVEISFGGVVSALSSINIYGAEVIYPNPTVTAGNQTICANSVATLTATPNGGTTLSWYSAATGGNLLSSTNNYTTGPLTNTTTYYIQVSKGGCANVNRIPVLVTVTPVQQIPVLATIAAVCTGSSTILSVRNPQAGTTYFWYSLATGGTALATGVDFTTPVLNANATYFVEAVNGSCVSASRAQANVTVNPRPVLPTLQTASMTLNPGQTALINASSIDANVNFNWYESATAASPVFTGATYVTPPLFANTTYYVEANSTVTGCSSASRVQITINVNAGGSPDPVACESPVSETHGISTGIISIGAGVNNPGLAIDNDKSTASTLQIPIGLASYAWQKVNFTGLSNVGDTVRIRLSSASTLLSASLLGGVSIVSYNGTTANAGVLSLNNPLINLQLLSGGTDAIIQFVPTATFDGVEVRLNSGLLGALTSINFNYAQRVLQSPMVTAANVAACPATPAALSVATPLAGIVYKWYNAAGVFQADGATFSPTVSANTKFFVEATRNGCTSARATVNVTLQPVPRTPALLSNAVQTCTGSNLTFKVQNPEAGVSYRWFKGDILIAGEVTDSLKVVGITATTTYSVEAVNTTCSITAAARASVMVTVGSLDAPIVSPNPVTIFSGERVLLNASSVTTGLTYKWFTVDPVANPTAVPVSTASNGQNGTFLTPILTANQTYYVIANGACTSLPTSVAVIVIASPNPAGVPCEPAVAEENGTSGTVILAGVDNPNAVFDNNINSGSTLRIPIGLAGSVYQRAIFTGNSSTGDSVRVRVVSPAKLLSVSLLPSMVLTTYKGSVSNNDALALSSPLLNVTLLGAGSEAVVTFKPNAVFDRVELRLNSGLIGALSSVNFNYAQRIIAAPVVTAATSGACTGAGAMLSVQNPQTDGSITYKWYDGTTYQGASKDGAVFNTDPTLTAGTYNFFVSANRNGCESPRTKIAVTILGTPLLPVPSAGNPAIACLNTPVTLRVDAVAGITYNWYSLPALGTTLVLNNNSYSVPTNLPAGTYNFYVEAVNSNGCVSSTRTKITLIIRENTTAADIVIANQTLCNGLPVVLRPSSTTVNSPVFTFYANANKTGPITAGITENGVLTLTGLIPGTYTYYIAVSGNGACETAANALKSVTVTINGNATASDITLANQTVCAGTPVVITPTSETVTNPTFTFYAKPDKTGQITAGVTGNGVLTLTGLAAGTYTYYIAVSGTNKCENASGTLKAVTVTIRSGATAADVVLANQNTCFGLPVVLSPISTTVTNPVFTFYANSDKTGLITAGVSGNGVLTLNGLTSGTHIYYVAVSGTNTCESEASALKAVTVTINSSAIASDITLANQTACQGTPVVLSPTSTTVTNPVFTFYANPDKTGPITTAVSGNGVLTLSGLASGTYTYYVAVGGTNKCENVVGTLKSVTVTITGSGSAADVTVADQTVCQGSTVVLSPTSATITSPIFTFYANANKTGQITTGVTGNGVLTLTGLAPNTYTYYIAVSGSNKCESPAGVLKVVTVVVNKTGSATDIILANQTVCQGSNITLAPTSTTVTNPVFTFYANANKTGQITAGVSGNGVLTLAGLAVGTYTYYVSVRGTNTCESDAGALKLVTARVTSAATDADITIADQTVCQGASVVLTPTSATVTSPVFTFYANANKTNPITVGVTGNGVLTLTGLAPATYTYYVAVSGSNRCESAAGALKQVTVVVNRTPVAPPNVTVTNPVLCSGTMAQLDVVNPDVALTYRWYSTAVGGTALFSGTTYTTGPLNATTVFYVESVNATQCSSTSRTAVTVNVLPVLSAPVVVVQLSDANSITFAWAPVTGATGYEVSTDGGLTWTPPNSGATGLTHLVTGLKPGVQVTIQVRAKGTTACQTSTSTSLTGTVGSITGNDFFVPNTFTPNGDGKNDIFYVYGNTIAKMKLRVYNQWGQFLFESLNIQSGWDGNFKGEMQPNGVYVYELSITFADGTTGAKKGTITLLR